MHTNDHKRERKERVREEERAGRDWGAHANSMDLSIEGVMVS